ncbi:MAG TPA: extradiol ring-cleavage dioxygenase [Candidatus Binatia bacterium]
MGEIIGIGMSHAPHLQFTDSSMANIVRRLMKSESTPENMRDPKQWPAAMQREWGDDEGLASAAKHRSEQVRGLRAVRKTLDKFQPDFILIWGDDQYENFREDLIPPFCVYVLNEIDCPLFKQSKGLGATANVWNEPSDKVLRVKCHPEGADSLARGLLADGFDVAWSNGLRHADALGHAFLRTVLYLDYDRKGFDFPIVPFHVNCYGSNLRVPPGRIRGPEGLGLKPPPSPPPWRCYDLGKAVANWVRNSPWRVAVIGSSSWSHGSLTAKHAFMYPDIEADQKRLMELKGGDLKKWRLMDAGQMVDSGQHEMLNWVCLAGAAEGMTPQVLSYAETYLFNSDKAIVLFENDNAMA